MMILSTVPVMDKSGESINVHWSTGYINNGIVSVVFDKSENDMALIAEFITIRHLLFTREVFSRKPVSGKGYELKVFSGAIRKIVLGRSSKENIIPYGLFLTGSMYGVEITVKKQTTCSPLFGTQDTWQKDFINADDNEDLIPQELWNTALGELYITRHAIEQYEARTNERNRDSITNPERSFFRVICPKRVNNFHKTHLPEAILKHKLTRYGNNNVEVWRNPTTSLHLTVIRKKDSPGVLVTSFYRG